MESSVKLFKIKVIIAIVLSLIIVDWYCDKKDISVVLRISTEHNSANSEEDIQISNLKIKIGDN